MLVSGMRIEPLFSKARKRSTNGPKCVWRLRIRNERPTRRFPYRLQLLRLRGLGGLEKSFSNEAQREGSPAHPSHSPNCQQCRELRPDRFHATTFQKTRI